MLTRGRVRVRVGAGVGLLLFAALALASAAVAAVPVAHSQSLQTNTDTVLPISLTAKDNDNQALTFTATDPPNGTLNSLSGNMTCTGANCSAAVQYTPDAAFQGLDTFTFTVNDGTATSNEATVEIVVDTPPVAVDDPSASCQPPGTFGGAFPIVEDWPEPFPLFGSCGLLSNDTDADAGDALDYELVTQPAHGVAVRIDDEFTTYEPDPDFSTLPGDEPGGQWVSDSFTYRAFDGLAYSAPATMRIWVAPINDPPTFTPGATVVQVDEDSGAFDAAWASAVAAGPANESAQTVAFDLDVDVAGVPNLFAVDPAIDADGTLTFTPAANEIGLATITVTATDDGGLEDWDVTKAGLPPPDDTSDAHTFTIVVNPINDAPVFTKGANETVLEDAGAQAVPGWATGMAAGGIGESGQVLSFEIASNSNPALFAAGPTVAPNGTLAYTPAANASGSASVGVRLTDDGGTANGGVDTSATQTFTITVTPVNDPPSFTKGADQTVAEDSGARSVNGWATFISAGAGGEGATQTRTFEIVSNTTPGLFGSGPAVAANGTLTFTPATNQHGTATIGLRLTDDGGTANGGVDASATQTFTITVTAGNDPPNAANDVGLTVAQNATAVPLTVLANDTDLDGQALAITAKSNGAHGTVTITGGGTGLTYTPVATYRGSDAFTYTVSDGTATDTATVLLQVVQAGAVTRISGTDRYATSAAISKASFGPNVAVAYIASGTGFADALSGAPVAGIKGGPILLVPGTSIPASIAAELTRLKPARIVILGGTGAVSGAVATALDAYTTGPVTRLAGADRYATSAAISRASFNANVPVAYIASGTGFADALSGAPVAAIKGGPILLVPGTSIPASIATELSRLKPARIVILGGGGAVSSAVATALDAYTTGAVTRISGADRYATSAAISAASFNAHVPVVYVASGTGFADALSGAPVAGIAGGPILLVPGTSLPASIAAELIRLKPANVVILGGAGAVSSSVATQLGTYTTGP